VDPHQVRPDDEGLLRCTGCGFAYDLDPAGAAAAVRRRSADFVAGLATVPQSAVDQRPDPRTWSVNGYAAHVADVTGLMCTRLHRVLEEDHPDLLAYDEALRAERGHFDTIPVQRSITELSEHVVDAVAVLDRVSADPDADGLWRRTGEHPEQGELAMWQVACDLVHELQHHAQDVVAVVHRVDDLRD
jgi:hypothetical protein